jgi:hypothetical protein
MFILTAQSLIESTHLPLKEGPRRVGHCAVCGERCLGFTDECDERVLRETDALRTREKN